MAKLTPEEIYRYALGAGFSPDEAVTMTAIALSESGGNTTAHNPNGENSQGLWQINRDAHSISGNLYDPATNAAAAYQVYTGAGRSISPWTVTHKKNNYMYTRNQQAAVAAAAANGYADAQGNFGGSPGYGTKVTAGRSDGGQTTATNADTSGNAVPTGAAPNAFDGTVPADMRVINVGAERFVGVQLAPNVWAYFDGPQVEKVKGIPEWSIDPATWQAVSKTRIGDVSELDDLASSYSSFSEFFEEMMYLAGIPKAAMSDPTIITLLAEFSSRPDMSNQELVRRLQETDWYQTTTDRTRQWNDMGTADKNAAIDEQASNVLDAIFRYGGYTAEYTDPVVQQWAEQIASGQTTLTKLINTEIKPLAQANPDSPWSRTIRDEERAQRQTGIDYENSAGQARALARRWGVQLSDDEALEWGRKITENVMSQNDLTEYLKDVAQSLYPWKNREMETLTAAQPYMQTFANLYEVSAPDIFDPSIQSAMQAGITTSEWAKQLRADPRWMSTQNAEDTMASMGSQISRMMGFS